MAVPDPTEIAPWYLRNITQALALDETTGTVYLNTNAQIIGNVTIGASVDSHVSELGNVDISGTTLPATVYQGTDPWTVSVDNQSTDLTVADSNYEMNVARGLVAGQSLDFKNGYCPNMTAGGKTIWSQGTLYPWSSWTTSQQLHIISDSASDTGQTIHIDGLDSSYNPVSETVTTNGLTSVTTSHSYLRINHVYIAAGNTNVGTITQRLVSGTGTVIGAMVPGNARNKQGVFTVPNGYTAYILYGDVTSYKNGQGQVDGQVDMMVRMSQSTPFMNSFTGIASNGQFRNDFNVPLAVPQHADIDVRFNSSGTCTVACNWEMILIAN